jgi:hypothetical protein
MTASRPGRGVFASVVMVTYQVRHVSQSQLVCIRETVCNLASLFVCIADLVLTIIFVAMSSSRHVQIAQQGVVAGLTLVVAGMLRRPNSPSSDGLADPDRRVVCRRPSVV